MSDLSNLLSDLLLFLLLFSRVCLCVLVCLVCCQQSVGVQFEAHSVVTCAALYKAFTFCKQEMNRYLAQLEKGQVRASNDRSDQ